MQVGDKVRLRFGPYETIGTVTEIKDAGAVVSLTPQTELVGWDYPATAPSGEKLTTDRMSTFIGRAHWSAKEVVDDTVETTQSKQSVYRIDYTAPRDVQRLKKGERTFLEASSLPEVVEKLRVYALDVERDQVVVTRMDYVTTATGPFQVNV